jgi:hypothetical protein
LPSTEPSKLPPAGRDDTLAIGGDRHGVIALDLERASLEGVSLAAAADVQVVGLHERLKPLADGSRGGPLAIVTGGRGCNHGESRERGEWE